MKRSDIITAILAIAAIALWLTAAQFSGWDEGEQDARLWPEAGATK